MTTISKSKQLLYDYLSTLKSLVFTSEPLKSGTYKFRLDTIDNLGNRTSSTEQEITILNYPAPPTDLAITYDDGTGTATITWTASADADHYEVYSNGGDDDNYPAPVFDTDHLLDDTVSGTSYETSILTTGTWWFGVRAVDSDDLRENNIMRIGPITIPYTGTIPDNPGVPDDDDDDFNRYSRLEFERVSIGKLKISFLYYGNAICTHFHVYVGVGEEPDFTSAPTYSFDRNNYSYRQEYTTPQLLYQEDTTLYICVKAASATDIESESEDTYQIDVDGIAPIVAQNITIEAST